MAIARFKLAGWMILFVAAGAALQTGVFGANSLMGAAVGLIIMLGLLAFTIADWRLMDEASREAHKTAGFWSMGIGATLWAIGIIALMYLLGPDFRPSGWGGQGSLAMFALGGLAALIAQLACYVAAVAVWWVTKR